MCCLWPFRVSASLWPWSGNCICTSMSESSPRNGDRVTNECSAGPVVLGEFPQRVGGRLLRAPEHQLLQPVLLLRRFGRNRRNGVGGLRTRLLACLRPRPKRSSHELRQALNAGAFASALGDHVRIKCARCAGRTAVADVAAASATEVAVRVICVSCAEHG